MSGTIDIDADKVSEEPVALREISPVDEEEDPLVTRLREMILSGEFEPGSIVAQVPLARSLGISTTPLREAMRQLQSEGLLEFSRNRRARVARLDVEDLHAVYAARVLLEAHAVAMTAVSAGEELRERVREDVRQMDQAETADDLDEWTRLHALFHLDLVSGATPQLVPTIRNFLDRAERYRRLARVSARPRTWLSPHDEHRLIADAFTAGDGTRGSAHSGDAPGANRNSAIRRFRS